MVSVVIHANPRLQHQQDFAQALTHGFCVHNVAAQITADRRGEADLHVVLGPHYALRENQHRRILYADRCFFGDARWTVSLGWLKDGVRDFMNRGMAAAKGSIPQLAPRKARRRHAVILADYGGINRARHWEVDARKQYEQVYFREHPNDRHSRYFYSLDEMWERCDVAIGGKSTALVDAAINGLHVETHDPHHVCCNITDRQQWLTDLSWAQWTIDECHSGQFWEHLQCA